MEDAERQAFEIEALESIYDGLKVTDNKGTILLDIELEDEVKIGTKSVNYLPPIQFKFKLLPTYPSSSPPLIHLSSSWLTLQQLTVQGSKLVGITFFYFHLLSLIRFGTVLGIFRRRRGFIFMDRYTFGKFLATAFFNFDQNLIKNCRLRSGCASRGASCRASCSSRGCRSSCFSRKD